MTGRRSNKPRMIEPGRASARRVFLGPELGDKAFMLDAKQRRRAQELHDTAAALGAKCNHADHRREIANGLVVGKAAPGDLHHPGWPAGTPGGLGGKFMPTNVSAALAAIPADSPKRPVPLVDSNGKPILDDNGKPVLRPADMPPEFFVQQGQAVKDEMEATRQLAPESEAGASAVMAHQLLRFRQGQAWDAQRVDGKYIDEYRDYATIGIGLYAAASGWPIDKILAAQDDYAKDHSKFNEPLDPVYTHLAARNVRNTEIGYELYRSGRIKPSNP